MKTLWEIMSWVSQKDRFVQIEDYVEFAKYYLEFILTELQAEIVAQNENNYRFFNTDAMANIILHGQLMGICSCR